jgi:hypothetical protein
MGPAHVHNVVDEAIKTAFEQEERLAIEMMNQTTERSKKALAVINHTVYTKAHIAGFQDEQNRRLGNMLDGWEHWEWSQTMVELVGERY